MTQTEKKRLNDLKETYTKKRDKQSKESHGYWRYSGKIEVVNQILEEFAGQA